MFKIHDNTNKSIPPEIDFFTVPITSIGIESTRIVEVTTSNSVQTVPYEFRINNTKNFIDLQRSYILARCSIRDESGNKINKTTGVEFAPINLFGQTMFRQVQLFLSGVQVYDSGVLYPYRSFIQSVFSSTPDYKRTQLGMAGYTEELDPGSATDAGYKSRCTWAADSETMEFISSISADLFQQPRALVPYIDCRLVLHPSSDSFRVEQRTGAVKKYTVQMEELVFMSRQITCHDATMMAIDSMLQQQKTISYPLNNVQMRSFFISQGRTHAPECKLFTSATPRRLLCGFVASKNFNGTTDTNPFDFKPFNISEIFLDMGSETLPLRSWSLDFSKGKCARAYLGLQETLGFPRTGDSNGISPIHFKDGHTLFGFDISPNPHESDTTDLLRMGETSLRITFSQPVQEGGIYCVVFAEFGAELTISHERIPSVESIL